MWNWGLVISFLQRNTNVWPDVWAPYPHGESLLKSIPSESVDMLLDFAM